MIRRLTSDTLDTRRQTEVGTPEQRERVTRILHTVKHEGDAALFRWTETFDGVALDRDRLRVRGEEVKRAYAEMSEEFVTALRGAAERIRVFHERQRRTSWWEAKDDGTILGQRYIPLASVGIYVPGGRAAYPSSVLMNAIPAKVAGVERIAMVTPPEKGGSVHPAILVAADIAGVTEIYKAGGAQAVAALAYGTESIPRVDKIVGPGNIYVALAKQSVFGLVDIDMIAGPSEIVVLADETADPAFVAADLLSQAEHDPLASAVLVTTSTALADAVEEELERQCQRLSRADIAAQSLRDYGGICVTDCLDEGIDVVNRLAPEHLELMVEDPWGVLGRITHAGAVFIGPYSPEPVGDYWAGPNHILPTNGTARFASPLSVDDFVKRSSLIAYSRQALERDAERIVTLAESEGLGGHAEAIRIRLDRREGESDE